MDTSSCPTQSRQRSKYTHWRCCQYKRVVLHSALMRCAALAGEALAGWLCWNIDHLCVSVSHLAISRLHQLRLEVHLSLPWLLLDELHHKCLFFFFVERSAQGGNNVRVFFLPIISGQHMYLLVGQHIYLLVCMLYYLDPIWLLTLFIPRKWFAEDVLQLLATSVHIRSVRDCPSGLSRFDLSLM